MLILMTILAAPVHAQGLAELVDGTPEFEEDCFEDSATCEDRFLQFLTHSMVEQGFTFQQVSQLTSPLVNRRDGVVLGAQLDTFPFAKPRTNLAGKEENTDYSPVLPRIIAGWTGGDSDGVRTGAGVFFLPPVPVKGASALVAGFDLGASLPLSGSTRLGAELDFTYTRANAPIVASEEQYENREDYGNNLQEETYEAVCAPEENGCIDVFTLMNPSLRVGASWELGDFTPHVRLGATYVREQLYVMYDDTTWLSTGLQYSAHVGGALAVSEGLRLGLGASTAFRPAAISEDGSAGMLLKLQGSAGWQF